MKTWVRLYDAQGEKYRKDYTLAGKWSEKSVITFIKRRPWLGNPAMIKIVYI